MFETNWTSNELRLRMSASLENNDQADALVSEFLLQTDVPVDRFAVRILLREALLNAVTHGCGKDPEQEVRLCVRLEPDAIVLDVQDSGPGFLWQDRNTMFDVLGDGGRGLALMRIYSSNMTFNEAGNHVVLRRRYDSAAVCQCAADGEQT